MHGVEAMSDCIFQRDGGPWTCSACGWVYPRPSANPPRRNCPNSEEVRRAAAERLAIDIMARIENGTATRSATEIEARLVECRKCSQFTGDGCKHFDGCDGSSRPLFLIVLTSADRWCKRGWNGRLTDADKSCHKSV